MTNRFDQQSDALALEQLDADRRIALGAAALARMRPGYAIWAPRRGDRASIEDIMSGVWGFVINRSPLPSMEAVERLYPSPDEAVTLESPFAESFIEALQLFTDFAATKKINRLVEIRQAAYNMAFDAAGDASLKYSDPGYDGRMTPDRERRIELHPWVSRELEAQAKDVEEARRPSTLQDLVDGLRRRAEDAPVITAKELDDIGKFQAG